jgi:hypothetical protein
MSNIIIEDAKVKSLKTLTNEDRCQIIANIIEVSTKKLGLEANILSSSNSAIVMTKNESQWKELLDVLNKNTYFQINEYIEQKYSTSPSNFYRNIPMHETVLNRNGTTTITW